MVTADIYLLLPLSLFCFVLCGVNPLTSQLFPPGTERGRDTRALEPLLYCGTSQEMLPGPKAAHRARQVPYPLYCLHISESDFDFAAFLSNLPGTPVSLKPSSDLHRVSPCWLRDLTSFLALSSSPATVAFQSGQGEHSHKILTE